MTNSFDAVDVVLEAYFDYLEGTGEEPTLDHLSDAERAEAEQLIASLRAGRGIDPEASRPSVAALIARSQDAIHAASEDTLERTLQAGLRDSVDAGALVVRDVASVAAGLASRLVVHTRGVRIRVVIEPAGSDIDARRSARLRGRWMQTAREPAHSNGQEPTPPVPRWLEAARAAVDLAGVRLSGENPDLLGAKEAMDEAWNEIVMRGVRP